MPFLTHWEESPTSELVSVYVRMGDYKLIQFYKTGKAKLYNLSDDIGEHIDLSGQQPERVKTMQAMLRSWLQSTGIQPGF